MKCQGLYPLPPLSVTQLCKGSLPTCPYNPGLVVGQAAPRSLLLQPPGRGLGESQPLGQSHSRPQGTKHGLFQGIVWPQVLSGVVGNCVNGITNYVLVSVLGLGVR